MALLYRVRTGLALVLACAATLGLVGGSDTYAVSQQPGKATNGTVNKTENAMKATCSSYMTNPGFDNAIQFLSGTWINDTPSDPYKIGITLDADQTSGMKTIYIYGSVLTCGKGSTQIAGRPAIQKIYKSNEPTGTTMSTDYRISFVDAYLNMGMYPAAPTVANGGWFSDYAKVTATINVGLLTIPAAGGSSTEPIVVCTNGVATDPNVAWSFSPACTSMYVTVTRKAAPIITGTTYRGTTNADYTSNAADLARKPGETYYFRHELRNSGAATTAGQISTCTVTQTVGGSVNATYNCGNTNVGAGGTTVAYETGNITVPNSYADGTKICQYMTYTALPGTGTQNTQQLCVVVTRQGLSGMSLWKWACAKRSGDNDYTCGGNGNGNYAVVSVLEGQQFNFRHYAVAVNDLTHNDCYNPLFSTSVCSYPGYYGWYGLLGSENQRVGGVYNYLGDKNSWSAGQQISDTYYPSKTTYLTATASMVGNTYCYYEDEGVWPSGAAIKQPYPAPGWGGRACVVVSRPWAVEPVTLVRKKGTTTWSTSVSVKPTEQVEFKHALIVRNASISLLEALTYRSIKIYGSGAGTVGSFVDAAGNYYNQDYSIKKDLRQPGETVNAAAAGSEFVTSVRTISASGMTVGGTYCEYIYAYAPGSYGQTGLAYPLSSQYKACINIVDDSGVIGGGGASGIWRLEGSSKVKGGSVTVAGTSDVTVNITQSFTFEHKLLVKDANMTKSTSYKVYQTVNGSNLTEVTTGSRQSNVGYNVLNGSSTGSVYSNVKSASNFKQDDKICQYIYYMPSAYNNEAPLFTTPVCAVIKGEPWTLTGKTQVKKAGGTFGDTDVAARPDEYDVLTPDVVAFRHTITVGGGSMMGNNTTWDVYECVKAISASCATSDYTKVSGQTGVYTGGNGSVFTRDIQRRVTMGDVDKKTCQYIQFAPSTHNSSSAVKSTARCATIPYNYIGKPVVAILDDVDLLVEPGQEIQVGKYINVLRKENASVGSTYATKTKSTEWKLYRVKGTLENGKEIEDITVSGRESSDGNICSAIHGLVVESGSCKAVEGKVSEVFEPKWVLEGDVDETGPYRGRDSHSEVVDSYYYMVPDTAKVGEKFCFVLTMKPRSDSEAGWVYSDVACVNVGKKPIAQVLGGGVYAYNGVYGTVSLKSNRYYGSWTEYEAIASVGPVQDLASGAFLGMNGGLDPSTVADSGHIAAISKLTMANRHSSDLGRVGFSTDSGLRHKLLDSAQVSEWPSVEKSGMVGVGVVPAAGKSLVINAVSDITLDLGAKMVPHGTTLFVNADEYDVTIGSDIRYAGGEIKASAHGATDIPQVVIVARNIKIAPSVTEVDAWLVASKRVHTCGDKTLASIKYAGECAKQLKINGPVYTNELVLARTYGAEAGAGGLDAPAEVMDLRPDAYLWAMGQFGRKNNIATVYEMHPASRY